MDPTKIEGREDWNCLVSSLAQAHVLQCWEWGEFKSHYGWQPTRWAWRAKDGRVRAAAQMLSRQLAIPALGTHIRIAYCPRGPLLDWSEQDLCRQVLGDMVAIAREGQSIFIKADPQIPIHHEGPLDSSFLADSSLPVPLKSLARLGWRPSPEQIQFRNTMLLDLEEPEARLLESMKQKTRYNIRLAARRGVKVRLGDPSDLDLLYRMYAETSLRDSFAIRKPEYYRHAWQAFIKADLAQPFIAEVDGEAVAGLILFHFGSSAWYFYGMSRESHREKMPNYLLQWEAIRWARQRGYRSYDFWGAPDDLSAEQSLWGVYRFKSGFGAKMLRTSGAWDYPIRSLPYRLYTSLMPILMGMMRTIGRSRTRASLD